MTLVCRGIRGATTVTENTRDAILSSTTELLRHLAHENTIQPDDLAAAIFTTTRDLNAAFPAEAARKMGWTDVALLDSHEMDVPNGLPNCIRVLLLVNTIKSPRELVHVYLREAKNLRSRGVKSE